MPGKATGGGLNLKRTNRMACKAIGEGHLMRTNMFALVHEFGMDKVDEIMARTEIPYDERIEIIWTAIDAANPTYEIDFNEDEYVFAYEEEMDMDSKSDGEDDAEADEFIRKFLEEKNSVTVKRPPAPVECEQECKKPRIAEGEEHEAGEAENLPQ